MRSLGMSAVRPATLIPALAAALALTVSGCGGGGDEGDSAAALTSAKETLDRASSVHFRLSSADVPAGGTRLTAGEGVAARPSSFQGSLSITLSGGSVSVELVSVDGKVYAKLPFAPTFQETDPADFGLRDPATLIDPKTGLSQVLGQLTEVSSKGERRIGADVTQQIDGNIPGAVVGDLLTSADPGAPVKASLYVTKDGNQLRQAVLTGPFYEKGTDSTFTLVLDKYGDNPPITLPAGVGSAPAST